MFCTVFPRHLRGFRRGTAAPSICNRVDDGVKLSDTSMTLWWSVQKDQSESCLWTQVPGDVEQHYSRWIPGDNSCRLHRGDGLDDGRDARQDTHDGRNPHTAPDRGRRETCGRSKTTSVSCHCGKGTVDPHSSTWRAVCSQGSQQKVAGTSWGNMWQPRGWWNTSLRCNLGHARMPRMGLGLGLFFFFVHFYHFFVFFFF